MNYKICQDELIYNDIDGFGYITKKAYENRLKELKEFRRKEDRIFAIFKKHNTNYGGECIGDEKELSELSKFCQEYEKKYNNNKC